MPHRPHVNSRQPRVKKRTLAVLKSPLHSLKAVAVGGALLLAGCSKEATPGSLTAPSWNSITNSADYRRWWSYPTQLSESENAHTAINSARQAKAEYRKKLEQDPNAINVKIGLSEPYTKDLLSNAMTASEMFLEGLSAVGPKVGQYISTHPISPSSDVYETAYLYTKKILSGADESADIKAELNNQYKSASQLACVQASVVYYAALATLAPSSEKKTLSKFRIDIVAGMYVGPEAEESRRGVGHLFIRVVEGDVDSGIEDSLFLDASPDEMLIRFRGTCDTHRGFVGKGITFSPQTGEQLSRAHMILLVPPDLR